MKRKLKKIICFFIIVASCVIIGKVNSYAEFFSDKITYSEANDKDIYAPFKSAFGGNLTFCREHGKRITGFGNIQYEKLDDEKPLKTGTAYLLSRIYENEQKIKYTKGKDKDKLVSGALLQQAAIWYLNRDNMESEHEYPDEKHQNGQYVLKMFNILSGENKKYGEETHDDKVAAEKINSQIKGIIKEVTNKEVKFYDDIDESDLSIDLSKMTTKSVSRNLNNVSTSFIELNTIYPQITDTDKLGSDGNIKIKVLGKNGDKDAEELTQYAKVKANDEVNVEIVRNI